MMDNYSNTQNKIFVKNCSTTGRTRLLTVWTVALALCMFVGLCSACSNNSAIVANGPQPSNTQTQSFSTTKQPTIIVKGALARVDIHTGNDDSVVTTITKQADTQTKLDGLQVTAEQSGDTITVNAQPLDDPTNESINLNIATAQTTDLTVQLTNGSININGVQGNMQLEVSDKGEITAKNVKGVISARASNGPITLDQADLSGKSQSQTQNGAITFTGTLDPQGDYQFQNNVGPIDVTLPASASFHLSASSESGIVTNDFQSNDVGQQPRANLTVTNQKGLIHIHEGQ